MNALKGKDFMLYVRRHVNGSDVMVPVVCATTMTLTFSQDLKEATKPAMSRARSYYPGMYGYTISLDGVYVDNPDGKSFSARDFIKSIFAGEELQWVAVDSALPEHFYSGFLLQNSTAITSPADGLHTFSTSLTGTGDVLVTNPYGTFVYADTNRHLYNEQGIIIGYKQTGGMPPFVE